jgi:ABC-type multidrug transport system ATPase subunit
LNSILFPFQATSSGLDNILILCQILRIDPGLLKERLKEIVAFSELGEQVHNRVSSYSRGMYGRLAAAAALHLRPDILLIDDSFTVGDHGFREKVDARLWRVVEDGAILLYAGHKLSVLQARCDRALCLQRGRLRADGPADHVVQEYSSSALIKMEEQNSEQDDPVRTPQILAMPAVETWVNPTARSKGPKLLSPGEGSQGNLVSFTIENEQGQQPAVFNHPAKMRCVAVIETLKSDVTLDVQIEFRIGKVLAVLARPAEPFRFPSPARHRIVTRLDSSLLPDQLYTAHLKVSFLNEAGAGQEMVLSLYDFLLTGRTFTDQRWRRFAPLWPPRRLAEPFLRPSLHWDNSPVIDD